MSKVKRKFLKKGFTFIELMAAVGILGFVYLSFLLLFINSIIMNEVNRNFTLAYSALKSKMEEIKDADFDDLDTSCPGGSFCNGEAFDLEGFPSGRSKARIEIALVTGESYGYRLKKIRLIACFKSRNRVIGEDTNLNGACDSGECGSNSRLDSPVALATLIADPE